MKLISLKLCNFRNYNQLILNPSLNTNILYGKNGSGKTNIVEAIYTLALTKSFRSINDNNLIKYDSDYFNINGIFVDKLSHQTSFKIYNDKNGKAVFINKDKIKLLSDYISKINIILFSPNDLRLIKDSPNIRRKYLNIEISQYDKNYLFYLNDYNKVLKQRNFYLKQLSVNYNQSFEYLDILTDQLIDKGIKVFKYREDFINKLSDLFSKYYENITGIDNISIIYKSDFSNKDKNQLKSLFEKNKNRELNFGKTLIGVHLDDFDILLNGFHIKDFGSEGQQKNAVVSLKFAEIELLKRKYDDYPILILDDIFSELDSEKINNIMSIIPQEMQTFITTTEVEKLDRKVLLNSKIFNIKESGIGEVKYEE